MKINSPAGWIVFIVIVVLCAVVIGVQAGPVGAIAFLAVCGMIGGMAYSQAKSDPNYQKNKKEMAQNAQDKKYQSRVHKGDPQQAERFYRECVNAGIRDLNRPADQERMKLFAKNHQIEGSAEELAAAYEKGKICAGETDRAEREKAHQEKLRQIKAAEDELRNNNRRFSQLFGREKPIQICESEIRRCDLQIAQLETAYNNTISGASSLMQKKGDWAIAGGIADGLAGPAAGIATAVDVMQKNAAIDQQNRAVANLSFGMQTQILSQQRAAREEKESWEKRLEKYKARLIQELPPEELMAALDCRVIGSSVSETGAVHVKVRVEQKTPVYIFEDVKAVVDGSIRVIVRNKQKKVCAEGLFALPLEGAVSCGVEVLCRGEKPVNPAEKGEICFEPNKLWAMER